MNETHLQGRLFSRSVRFALVAFATLSGCSTQPTSGLEWLIREPEVMARPRNGIPQQNLIFDGELNGRASAMLVDTGAEHTMVVRSFAEASGMGRSGPAVTVEGIANDAAGYIAVANEIALGQAATFSNVPAVVVDLDVDSPGRPVPFRVIIGLDLLRPTGAVVDFEKRALRFQNYRQRATDEAPKTAETGWVSMAVQGREEGLLYLACEVGARRGVLVVDTGATYSLLAHDSIDEERLGSVEGTVSMTTGSGVSQADIREVRDVMLGGARIPDRTWAIGQDLFAVQTVAARHLSGARITGVLGADVMSDLGMQIDVAARTIRVPASALSQ